MPETMQCPECGETIKLGASICRYCRHDLGAEDGLPKAARHVGAGTYDHNDRSPEAPAASAPPTPIRMGPSWVGIGLVSICAALATLAAWELGGRQRWAVVGAHTTTEQEAQAMRDSVTALWVTHKDVRAIIPFNQESRDVKRQGFLEARTDFEGTFTYADIRRRFGKPDGYSREVNGKSEGTLFIVYDEMVATDHGRCNLRLVFWNYLWDYSESGEEESYPAGYWLLLLVHVLPPCV